MNNFSATAFFCVLMLLMQFALVWNQGQTLSIVKGEIDAIGNILNQLLKQPIKPAISSLKKYAKPSDITRIYTFDDFSQAFGIEPVHKLFFDANILPHLDSIDIKKDSVYTDDPQYSRKNIKLYSEYLESESHEAQDRENLYIKWSTKSNAFALFANRDFEQNQVIGVYAGFVTRISDNTNYLWNYNSLDEFGEYNFVIDTSKMGNYMVFVNSHPEQYNCRVEPVAFKNRWQLVYVADAPIKKNEE